MPDVYTLAQHLLSEKDPLRAGVIHNVLERVKIMEVCPFVSLGTFTARMLRWNEFPDMNFRNLNEPFGSSIGNNELLEETVFVAGGNIDIEALFTEDNMQLVDPRSNQLEMFSTSMSFKINNYFINGDQSTDPKGFTGLKVRIAGLPATQTFYGATDGLPIFASTANENLFIDYLNQAMYAVDGATDIFMNSTAYLGFESTFRRAGLYRTTQDMFDRDVMVYKGARLHDMGNTTPRGTTKIITDTETRGNTATNTSIYFARFGTEAGEYLHGIDFHPLRVRDIGLLENGSQMRHNVEWPLGLMLGNDRAVSVLKGVRFAAS